jgi:transcriptional regulator with XRE-family HTH domain
MASLGARINEYRRRRNITQEQLAEAMGVTSQAVSKWENDISCPDISILPQLSDYFGVSLDVLLRGEPSGLVRLVDEGQRKSFDKMVLRILVNSADGDVVKVNFPMPLVKAGLALGMPMMHMGSGNASYNDTLRQIDFSSIIQLVESGAIGKLIEVKAADGTTVDIFVE